MSDGVDAYSSFLEVVFGLNLLFSVWSHPFKRVVLSVEKRVAGLKSRLVLLGENARIFEASIRDVQESAKFIQSVGMLIIQLASLVGILTAALVLTMLYGGHISGHFGEALFKAVPHWLWVVPVLLSYLLILLTMNIMYAVLKMTKFTPMTKIMEAAEDDAVKKFAEHISLEKQEPIKQRPIRKKPIRKKPIRKKPKKNTS